MKKVIFSLLLVFSVAVMTSCQKIETNTESSTKNKIIGTWEIVSVKSGNSQYSQYLYLQKGYLLSFWDIYADYRNTSLIIYGGGDYEGGYYCFSDSKLILDINSLHYELEINKLNDTKMSLSGKYWYRDYEVGSYYPIEMELERVVK